MRGVLLTLAWGWSVFGLIVQAALWSSGHCLISLLLSILFHGPATALVRGRWRAGVARAREEREFRGASAGSGELIHTEAGSGIALSVATGAIRLARPGVSKTYRFDDVREWKAVTETAGETIAVGGLASTISGAAAQVRAHQHAAANTGLFLRVRDIKHPEWRVAMSRKQDRDQWFEILTQAINERRELA